MKQRRITFILIVSAFLMPSAAWRHRRSLHRGRLCQRQGHHGVLHRAQVHRRVQERDARRRWLHDHARGRTLKGRFQYNTVFEGTYTYPDGKVYTGQWELRERSGRGTLKYADGRVYDGEFKSGLRHGKGVMTWPSGRRYEGDFVRGQRTGKGTLTYPDGRVYTGDFVDGEQAGRGVMALPDGSGWRGDSSKASTPDSDRYEKAAERN